MIVLAQLVIVQCGQPFALQLLVPVRNQAVQQGRTRNIRTLIVALKEIQTGLCHTNSYDAFRLFGRQMVVVVGKFHPFKQHWER